MAYMTIYPNGRTVVRPGPPPKGSNVVKRVPLTPADFSAIRPKLTSKPAKPCCTGKKK